MAIIARATYRWDGKLECSFPFSRFLVDQLKLHIPYPGREWDSERKIWIVEPVYATTAIRLMRDSFGEVMVEDTRQEQRDPFQAPNTSTIDPDCKALFILPTAPRCVVDAAYRALAREYHPDRGGVTSTMQALNATYERVRDRLAS